MESNGTKLTRLQFLKATAGIGALAAGGMLVGCQKPDNEPDTGDDTNKPVEVEEEVLSNVCYPGCGGNCPLKIIKRDGHGVRVEPRYLEGDSVHTDNFYGPCCKGFSSLSELYNPRRVLHPMRRVGPRGTDEWEQITWDEAIEEIATKWTAYREEFGSNSICNVGTVGGEINSGFSVLRQLMNVPFFFTGADYSGMWYQYYTHGAQSSSWVEFIATDSNNVIVWGTNPAATQPFYMNFINTGRERGMKLTVIDPYYSQTAQHADQYISVRPTTDAALAMSVCHEIISKERYDVEFVKNKTNAPFLIRKDNGRILRAPDVGMESGPEDTRYIVDYTFSYRPPVGGTGTPLVWDAATGTYTRVDLAEDPVLSGTFTIEGIEVCTAFDLLAERVAEWPVSRAAVLCGITEQEILDLTDSCVNGPTYIITGYGYTHYGNSNGVAFATSIISQLTGDFAIPGGGNGSQLVDFDVMAPGATGAYFNALPENAVAGINMPYQWMPKVMETGEFMGEPMPIKSLMICGGSLSSLNGRNQLIEKMLDKVEFIVAHGIWPHDMNMRYADIFLPDVHYYEIERVMGGWSVPYGVYCHQIDEPQGESMSTFEMGRLIAEKMGFTGVFAEGSFHDLFVKSLEMTQTPDWTYEIMQEQPVKILRQKGHWKDDGFMFPGEDNRTNLYIEEVGKRFEVGQEIDYKLEALPYFTPPVEAWPETVDEFEKNPLAEKYPLICANMHYKFGKHTYSAFNNYFHELNYAHVKINPEDAAARGIEHMDAVRIYNDRGSVTLIAHVDPATRPGFLVTFYGWSDDQFIEGNLNSLPDIEAGDHISFNECFCDVLVQIEKA